MKIHKLSFLELLDCNSRIGVGFQRWRTDKVYFLSDLESVPPFMAFEHEQYRAVIKSKYFFCIVCILISAHGKTILESVERKSMAIHAKFFFYRKLYYSCGQRNEARIASISRCTPFSPINWRDGASFSP